MIMIATRIVIKAETGETNSSTVNKGIEECNAVSAMLIAEVKL